MKTLETDILIIGAGVIGSALAQHLAPKAQTLAIDLDLEGIFSSSELNAGGVRATWAQPLNILCSKITIEYLNAHAKDVGYRPCGYLWLHGAEALPGALRARETQLKMGWEVEAWDVSEITRRVPLIDKTDGLAGAVFAPRDGLVNPNLMKSHFRELARASGAVFADRLWVESGRATSAGWEVRARELPAGISAEDRQAILCGGKAGDAPEVLIRAKRVVNCAGPWAPELARKLGYACPSKAVRRQVCIFDGRGVDLNPYGMIVDSSGVYFHPDAVYGLSGVANRAEEPGYRFDYDGESFFMEQIWPALYERSTLFEQLKHMGGWAGLYEVSPDESGIVGHGPLPGLFEAHSFSGHGVMHSFAVGEALTALITTGAYPKGLDLSAFEGSRFERGKAIPSDHVI